jgi:uncharacterized phage-associated protein
MPIQVDFDQQKAIEIILYIATRVSDPAYLRVLKLMYLADKTSLEMYGQFVSTDSYVAMEHGPVPTKSYDLIKRAKRKEVDEFSIEHEYQICPLRNPDKDELSESDIIVLDEIIKQYGSLPLWDLRDKTHDAAWLDMWKQSGEKNSIPIPIEKIARMSDYADDLIELLTDSHD